MIVTVSLMIIGIAIIGVLDMLYDFSGRDKSETKKVASNIGADLFVLSTYILISGVLLFGIYVLR